MTFKHLPQIDVVDVSGGGGGGVGGSEAIPGASVARDLGSTSIPTAGWTEIVASIASSSSHFVINDTGGQVMELALGGVGSEQKIINVPPGGFGTAIALTIPAGSRISVRAVDADATAGYFLADFFL